ncbi:MAG: T9SS type A sorting domain-containing protein [Candidatus Latescibacteria bacterium]|nr:T9SS type A sorting domain-containing protein [Candidatus Latescibacterota bacterium]
MNIKKFFISLAVFQCLMFFLFTSVCTSAVTGTVTDTDGNPVANADITFINETDPEIVFTGVTEPDGSYEVMGSTTVAGSDNNSNTPENFTLFQNYPNPFNPSTVIPFFIKHEGFVELSLYNLLGQKVRALINGYYPAGMHSVIWNGLDNKGKNAGSGVYIYRIVHGNITESRKLLLLDGGYSGSGSAFTVTLSPVKAVEEQVKAVYKTRDYTKPADGDTYRVVISGDSVFPFKLDRITVNDNDVLDFEISTYHEGIAQTFSPSGSGTIELTHDSMTFSMVFPEQSFSDEVTLTVKSSDELAPVLVLPDFRVSGKIWDVEAEYTEAGEKAQQVGLLKPTVLTIPYDRTLLDDSEDENDIFTAYRDGNFWLTAGGVLNIESNNIIVETDRLGLWSVFYGRIFDEITVNQAYDLFENNINNDNFVILDVRTPDEFTGGYIPGAINIDFRSETFENDVTKLDKSKTYLVYCLSGGRSGQAAIKMGEIGFKATYNMLGGIRDWIFEEYPLAGI